MPKNKVKIDLDMDACEDALNDNKATEVNFSAITSKRHQLYSINQTKAGLTSYDNKKYWINNVESFCYGHFKIQQ